MSNYQSHQSYQPPPSESVNVSMSPRVNAEAGTTTSVKSIDGQTIVEEHRSGRVTADQLNPHYQDGTVFETAKSNLGGLGVMEIKPDTLITIDGVQATCKTFENAGLIHRDSNGKYLEGSGKADEAAEEAPESTQEESPDALGMPEEVAAVVDNALDGVSDQQLTAVFSYGIASATGELGLDAVTRQVAQHTGMELHDAAARVEAVTAVYQAQADAAITSRCGIVAADLPSFYAYCQEKHTGTLRDAINKQVYSQDISGFRALATRFMMDTPPPLAAVAAAGFETRAHRGQAEEVFVDGRWMTIKSAAAMGHF